MVSAPAGEQEVTLHRECLSIGTLVGSGDIPKNFALRVLHRAASGIANYDSRRPWRAAEFAQKVDRSFKAGVGYP
jgi:hypothetical protein